MWKFSFQLKQDTKYQLKGEMCYSLDYVIWDKKGFLCRMRKNTKNRQGIEHDPCPNNDIFTHFCGSCVSVFERVLIAYVH